MEYGTFKSCPTDFSLSTRHQWKYCINRRNSMNSWLWPEMNFCPHYHLWLPKTMKTKTLGCKSEEYSLALCVYCFVIVFFRSQGDFQAELCWASPPLQGILGTCVTRNLWNLKNIKQSEKELLPHIDSTKRLHFHLLHVKRIFSYLFDVHFALS